MLTQSDLNALPLAYTYAQSLKKKTAIVTVFISTYEKYKLGSALTKAEIRVLKDYLYVYRSELLSLKKSAKMKNSADVVLDEQKKMEAKKSKELEKQAIEKLKIDVVEYKKQLENLNNELAKEREINQSLVKSSSDKPQKQMDSSINNILFQALQKFVFYDKFESSNDQTQIIKTLFMIGLGHIPPEQAEKFFNSYGQRMLNNRKELCYLKDFDNIRYTLTFFPYAETFPMIGKNDRSYILPLIFMSTQKEGKYESLENSQCFISLTSTPSRHVSECLTYRVSRSKKPENYIGIDYKNFENNILMYNKQEDRTAILRELGLNFTITPHFIPIKY